MNIKISKQAKLFKVNFHHPQTFEMLTTYCLAKDKRGAEKTFKKEYSIEYPKIPVLYISQLKPKDKKNEWKWYEFAFDKKLNESIIFSTSIIKPNQPNARTKNK